MERTINRNDEGDLSALLVSTSSITLIKNALRRPVPNLIKLFSCADVIYA
jgi:hypothetical protein